MEMFFICAIHYTGHWPRVARGHQKCGKWEGGIGFLVNIN